MAHNGWNSLGDIRELERKCKQRDMAEWGHLTLRLTSDMDYLNGCVKRGRGSDIDPNYPAKNVFEYIKELENKRVDNLAVTHRESFEIWWLEHGSKIARMSGVTKLAAECAYAAGFNELAG